MLLDGDHSIRETAYWSERVLSFTFRALNEYDVCLDAALLKPNMINAGSDCPDQATPQEVAYFTLRTMLRCVPGAMPGIHFLSGGMSDQEVRVHARALCVTS